jgi:hypothetical protein
MQQIDVDFDVFKALTALRESEHHTYNEVIRDLLGLERTFGRKLGDSMSVIARGLGSSGRGGFVSRGLYLPEGTMLRAKYRGEQFTAAITDGRWRNADGAEHLSPSGAAHAITGTNVNGLRFWEAKRPSDVNWRKLDALPQSSQ